jgi:hypothetical protein
VDAEACGAVSLLAGTDSDGDAARDAVVARRQASSGDRGGGAGTGEQTAAGGPRVGGLLFQIEINSLNSDGDGIAGDDVRGFC